MQENNIDFEKFVDVAGDNIKVVSKSGLEVNSLSALKKIHDSGDMYDLTKNLPAFLEQYRKELNNLKLKNMSKSKAWRESQKIGNGDGKGMFEPGTLEELRRGKAQEKNVENNDIGEVYR